MSDQRTDQLGHLGPGQAERGREVALRQWRLRAVAGVEVRLDDPILGRRGHSVRALVRTAVLTGFDAAFRCDIYASSATVAGLGFQPSFEKERGQRE